MKLLSVTEPGKNLLVQLMMKKGIQVICKAKVGTIKDAIHSAYDIVKEL